MSAARSTHRARQRSSSASKRNWSNDDLAYALECAADFLEAEEWPDDDGGAQVAAFREAAKRVRRMAARVPQDAHSPAKPRKG